MLDVPVVYLIFNRPDLTAVTFDAVRRARPRYLTVVADGPRADRPGEPELCAAARRVTDAVDWPCDVVRDYADANLGCGRRVSSGITAAFGRYDEAIVLEDDCLPDPSFFPYCRELLARYRDDPRVMAVSGDNFQGGRRGPASYYFSKYPHIWGWATWRRAWAHYDFAMTGWREFVRSAEFAALCPTRAERAHWADYYGQVASGRVDTWDCQWMYACWRVGGLTALPQVNLVANLGFRPDATHTTAADPARGVARPLGPLVHPPAVEQDAAADDFTFRTVFGGRRSAAGYVARLGRAFAASVGLR